MDREIILAPLPPSGKSFHTTVAGGKHDVSSQANSLKLLFYYWRVEGDQNAPNITPHWAAKARFNCFNV